MPELFRTVLCVDDDPDDRYLVRFTLGEIDPSIQMVEAADGVEALHYLSNAKTGEVLPGLVILDINMPRMDGKQTLAAIKKDEQLSEIPVVIFSTSNNPIDHIYCEHYGVELITKPSNMHTMHQELRRVLYRYTIA